MQQNPILTSFKIAAFAILAFLVWITFWGVSRQETVVKKMKDDFGQVRGELTASRAKMREYKDAVTNLSGKVEALTNLLASGGFRGPASAGGTQTPALPVTVDTGAPRYFSDKARSLWGRWPDYLEVDPAPVQYAALDDDGVDAQGRLRLWYGSTPSDISAVTSSDGRVSDGIEQYCLRPVAQRHVENPSVYGPELAIRVERSEDYKEWVVWLRNDALWHTPQVDLAELRHLQGRHHVTAHDIKFTLDLILNPDVKAAHLRSYYSECAGIEVIDDFCYVMRWRKPQYNSISYTLSIQPIPRFVFAFSKTGEPFDEGELGLQFNEHWFYRDNKYIGCGPYYVAELEPTSHVLLRRFGEYYGEIPAIAEIYQEIFDKRDLQVTKIERGELDAGNIPVRVWEKKVIKEKGKNPFSDGSMAEMWSWRTSYSFIGWKYTHPIFRDPEVRRAMTMACDRFRIRDVLELGRAAIATGPQDVNSPFCPPDLKPLPFDLDAARALLEKNGWADANDDGVLEKEIDGNLTEFRFTAMVPANDLFRPIFEIFKEDLSKIGVQMDLDMLQWKQFKERLDSRKFACTALLWSGDGWQSDLYQIWHSSQVEEVPSSNFIEFSDPIADELIVRLRGTFEHDDRVRLQRELHRRIAELQPYTFLHTYEMPFMYWKDRLGNVKEGARYATRPKIRYYPMSVLQDR